MSDKWVDPVEEHARLIGHVVIAWNEVHWTIYHLFVAFSGMPEQQAKDVFFTLRNDTSQRDMTLAAGKTALAPFPTVWEKFRVTINDLDKLASERNAAVHTMWGFNFYNALLDPGGKLTFGPMADTVLHKSLRDDFPTQCDQLSETLKTHLYALTNILHFWFERKERPEPGS